MSGPNPFALKHRPILLLPYSENDGPYAGNTDCLFLSVGWAQYDPRSLSVKTLRHTEKKWSRLSEELPLHRALDAALFVAATFQAAAAESAVILPPNTLEHQRDAVRIEPQLKNPADSRAFRSLATDDLLRRRLRSLRRLLNELHGSGEI